MLGMTKLKWVRDANLPASLGEAYQADLGILGYANLVKAGAPNTYGWVLWINGVEIGKFPKHPSDTILTLATANVDLAVSAAVEKLR